MKNKLYFLIPLIAIILILFNAFFGHLIFALVNRFFKINANSQQFLRTRFGTFLPWRYQQLSKRQ